MDVQTTIGKILRGMRKDKSLTLAELSADCNISVSYLSEIERDKANPTLGTLTEIFSSLGYSMTIHFALRNKE